MMHYHARTHEEVAEYKRQKAAKLAAKQKAEMGA